MIEAMTKKDLYVLVSIAFDNQTVYKISNKQ